MPVIRAPFEMLRAALPVKTFLSSDIGWRVLQFATSGLEYIRIQGVFQVEVKLSACRQPLVSTEGPTITHIQQGLPPPLK